MLPASFIFVAIFLRFLAGATYLRATWTGKARPSLVSWSIWGLTALIAFTIQMLKGSSHDALITLAIGLSPLAVTAAALYRGTGVTTLTRLDKWCIALSVLGIILWVTSRDPFVALFMSLVADFFSNIPTLLKAYRAPHTEHATAYMISVASLSIALLTVSDWQLVNWLFPAYILGVNVAIVATIKVFSKTRWTWARFSRSANLEDA